MVTQSHPPETATDAAGDRDSQAPVAVPTEAHAPSVHDALLETVSPDALGTARDHDPADGATETAAADPTGEAAVTPDTVEAAAPSEPEGPAAEPAPVMQPPEALDAAPAPSVPAPALAVVEAVSAPALAVVEAVPERVAALPAPQAVSRAVDVIGEITEANATILAYLRGEGSAAVAHWQTLSGARTPADAIRLQVDEMQRAADASLTCLGALARRAGRLASGIGRT